MAEPDGWDLSIDFGTSNTAAAIGVGGAIRGVTFEQGTTSMPSCVLVLNDEYRVGRSAQQQWRLAPDAYEPNPKKRLGEPTIVLGRREIPTVDLVGAVLWDVRVRAEALAGARPLRRLVLTHPEGWAPSRIAALREAAHRGGFRAEIMTVPEPIAAARRAESEGSDGGSSMVFDFGGGTCDVAVLAPPDPAGERRILASVGDDTLGGTDFDHRLLNWVLQTLRDRGDGAVAEQLRAPAALGARLTLLTSVQIAKEDLSDHQTATIPVVVGGFDTALQITRGEYEALIRSDVQRVRALVDMGLSRAGVASGALSSVHLTGGASQTPAIIRAVEEATGLSATVFHDPKLVVAEGGLLSLQTAAPPPAPRGRRSGRKSLLVGGGIGLAALLAIGGGVALALGVPGAPGPSPSSSSSGPTARSERTPISRTTVPTAPTDSSSPADACWDSSLPDGGRCPALTGVQAMNWAFPDGNSDNPRTCSAIPPPDGRIRRALACRLPDLTSTTLYLFEFTSPTVGRDYFAETVGNKYPDRSTASPLTSGDDRIGLQWVGYEGTGGAQNRVQDDWFLMYDRLPFGAWATTDVTAGGTRAEAGAVVNDVLVRSAASITETLGTVPAP